MKRSIACIVVMGTALLSSCAKQEPTADAPKATEPATAAPASSGGAPHVMVHLADGSKVPGTIVASTQTDVVVAGDDGIERRIPTTQVKSVDYGQPAARAAAPPPPVSREAAPIVSRETVAPPIRTSKTEELPVGSHVSVRMNEPIDSATAREGQTFDAQVTRDAKDAA